MIWPLDQLASRAQVAGVSAQVHDLAASVFTGLARLNRLESLMSELDTSVDDLTGAVADLATRIDTPSGELAAALTRIGELNAQITALSSDDQADSDSIAELTAERDTLLSDSAENVAKIQGVTEQVRGLAPAATPEPAPEPEPEPEPAPEPVDPSA